MDLVYLILPIALLIAAGFVTAFVWATRQGQFDDMDTPSMRVLGEDAEVERDDDSKVESSADSGQNAASASAVDNGGK